MFGITCDTFDRTAGVSYFGKCDKSIRVIVIDASSSVVPPSRGVCGYGDYGMTDCGSTYVWVGWS